MDDEPFPLTVSYWLDLSCGLLFQKHYSGSNFKASLKYCSGSQLGIPSLSYSPFKKHKWDLIEISDSAPRRSD